MGPGRKQQNTEMTGWGLELGALAGKLFYLLEQGCSPLCNVKWPQLDNFVPGFHHLKQHV